MHLTSNLPNHLTNVRFALCAPAGLEPATLTLRRERSIQLSYGGVQIILEGKVDTKRHECRDQQSGALTRLETYAVGALPMWVLITSPAG